MIWCFFTWLIDALAVSQLGQLFAWLHRHWERRCNRLGHCSRLQKDVYATLSSWWQGDDQLFNIFLWTWLIVVLLTESTQGVFSTTTNAAAPHFVQVNNHYFHLLKWTCFKLHIFFSVLAVGVYRRFRLVQKLALKSSNGASWLQRQWVRRASWRWRSLTGGWLHCRSCSDLTIPSLALGNCFFFSSLVSLFATLRKWSLEYKVD